MHAAVDLQSLTKEFPTGLRGGRLRAVDRLTLTFPAGRVCGLLGPNGSGKSTTIKLILGLLAPTAGRCHVFGQPAGAREARRQTGYLPEAPAFPRHLSGFELVRFYARICGLPRAGLDARVRACLAQVDLADVADRRVGTYSKGMLQRVGLAQAIVHDPRLVILDEPTAGLDPGAAAHFNALILRLKAAGKTVLITSHQLASLEEICDRVALLDRGRLLAEGEVGALNADGQARQSLVVEPLATEQLDALRSWLVLRGRQLLAVETPRVRLEEFYRGHVSRAPGEGGRP